MSNFITKSLQKVGVLKSLPVSTPYRADLQRDFFQLIGGSASYKFGGKNDFLEDYQKCPPLSTIIGRKTNAFTNGDTKIIDKNTGEEVKDGGKWYKFIENPNPLQTQTQFESQLYTYLHIYGFVVVLKVRPFGFTGNDMPPQALWVLPNKYLDIEFEKTPYIYTTKQNRIKSISLTYEGRTYAIEKDDCYIFTHLNACPTGNVNIPDSPLSGLEYPIKNIILAYEASGSLIKNNGAMGILSNKGEIQGIGTSKIDRESIEDLQRDYRLKYGLGKDQFKVIITSLNLDYQQMSMPISDLMLSEQIEENTKAIADKLGYPADLLGVGGNRTYENASQAGKDLYDMTIIPEATHFYQQYTECLFGTDMVLSVEADFGHVPAMQEDEADKARAAKDWSYAYEKLWKSDLMTRNQILEEQGKDPILGGDLYYSEWLQTINNENI